MGKYSGMIGFGRNTEVEPDIWRDVITERKYNGDIVSDNRRFNFGDTLSGNITFTNQFSIVGDTYLFDHMPDIRYITWKGNRWTVSSADEHYPRVTISIGGLYNGQTPEVEPSS